VTNAVGFIDVVHMRRNLSVRGPAFWHRDQLKMESCENQQRAALCVDKNMQMITQICVCVNKEILN